MVRKTETLGILIFLCCATPSVPGHSQDKGLTLEITATKERIIPYEQLNIEMTVTASEELREPVFEMYVNNTFVGGSLFEGERKGFTFPTQMVYKKVLDKYTTKTYPEIYVDFSNPDMAEQEKVIFDKPGVYKIKVVERERSVSSNELTVTVVEPSAREEAARKLFVGGEYAISAIHHIGEDGWHDLIRNLDKEKKTLADFKKIDKDYADTPFAPYASHIVGMFNYRTTGMQNKGSIYRKEHTRKIKEVVAFFVKSSTVEKSRLQQEALYILVEMQNTIHLGEWIAGKEDAVYDETFLKQLLETYPNGEYAKKAKEDRERSDLFKKEVNPEEYRRKILKEE